MAGCRLFSKCGRDGNETTHDGRYYYYHCLQEEQEKKEDHHHHRHYESRRKGGFVLEGSSVRRRTRRRQRRSPTVVTAGRGGMVTSTRRRRVKTSATVAKTVAAASIVVLSIASSSSVNDGRSTGLVMVDGFVIPETSTSWCAGHGPKSIRSLSSSSSSRSRSNNSIRLPILLHASPSSSQTSSSSQPPTPNDDDVSTDPEDDGDKRPTKIKDATSSFQFGDVVRLDDNTNQQEPLMAVNGDSTSITAGSSSSSTSTSRRLQVFDTPARKIDAAATDNDSDNDTSTVNATNDNDDEYTTVIAERRRKNVMVGILSVVAAIVNYAWQWTHPVTPIQLLFSMQQSSSPITVIGNTDKPTVIDFWAPWCENCKYMAPTFYQIEEQYRDRINFVMVNADNLEENWPLIEALGVDAIPHLSLIEADGTVDTALIGPVPKQWLVDDLEVLIENAQTKPKSFVSSTYKPLPHQMLDVFANKSPEQRRIHVEVPSDQSKSTDTVVASTAEAPAEMISSTNSATTPATVDADTSSATVVADSNYDSEPVKDITR